MQILNTKLKSNRKIFFIILKSEKGRKEVKREKKKKKKKKREVSYRADKSADQVSDQLSLVGFQRKFEFGRHHKKRSI
jgi:hypothetical protein